jgi:uncharacterized phiE125 gp8 family phage protein
MIDVDAAKAWVKKETADEDALIGGLVAAAVAAIEAQTGKNMSVKEFTQELAGFPCGYPYTVPLLRGPVVTITGVEYDPDDGSDAATIADFRLVEGRDGALLPAFGETWPATLDGPGTERISGTAGYADGEAPELDTAALMLVAHWYKNREAVNVGNSTSQLPLGVEMMIRPYRPRGLA